MSCEVSLPGLLDIAACGSLQQTLLELLGKHPKIVLDGSKVEKIGTPGLQFFLSACKYAGVTGRQLQLTHLSPIFLQAIEDIGLREAFSTHISPKENAA